MELLKSRKRLSCAVLCMHSANFLPLSCLSYCALSQPLNLRPSSHFTRQLANDFSKSLWSSEGNVFPIPGHHVDFHPANFFWQWLMMLNLFHFGPRIITHFGRNAGISGRTPIDSEMGKITCKMILIKDQDQQWWSWRSRSKIIFQGMI